MTVFCDFKHGILESFIFVIQVISCSQDVVQLNVFSVVRETVADHDVLLFFHIVEHVRDL